MRARGACSILTKDMVAPFTANKQMLDLIPPEEEPMGQFGCTASEENA